MPYNKGTLDAYRKIVCRELGVATGSGTHSGSAWISGSLVVTGDIKGGTFSGPIANSPHADSHYLLGTDPLLSLDATQISAGQFDNINRFSNTLLNTIRNHSPTEHAPTHTTGSSDAVYIKKIQITDIDNFPVTTPQLIVTGSNISSISGSLIVTGSISGSSYFGPVIRVRTGSATTYGHRAINLINAGAMIIKMSEDIVNDAVDISFEATGSGGGGGFGTVAASNTFNQASTDGIETTMSRSDHLHGTPGLYELTPTDISGSSAAGTSASGSRGDHYHRGVLSLCNSGSSILYNRIYLTGSPPNLTITQSGQIIQASLATSLSGLTNVYATNVSGSLISGSTFSGSTAVLTNVYVTNLTGSGTVSGSILRGSNAYVINLTGSGIISGSTVIASTLVAATFSPTNITATNVTGSTLVSGSTVAGPTGSFTNVYATNVSGSGTLSGSTVLASTFTSPIVNATNIVASTITGSVTLSGADIHGTTATISTITSTNVSATQVTSLYLTGSLIVSGSAIYGKDAVIINITGSNITGSTSVTATSFAGPVANITNINAVYITGSILVSGSTIYATTYSGSNLLLTGSISGSYFDGPVIAVRTGSTATTYTHRRLNFIDNGGAGWSLVDDPANNETQVKLKIESGVEFGSVEPELYFGKAAADGTSIQASHRDHTHGTPSLSANAAQDISDTASAGTENTGSRVDHVHRGVTSIANSGSSDLYGKVYFTGSGAVSVTQNGQIINISGSTGTGSGGSSTTNAMGYQLVNNGGTIPHTLGVTPSFASIFASGSTPVYFSYILDNTNITVYHTVGGSLGVFWEAVV